MLKSPKPYIALYLSLFCTTSLLLLFFGRDDIQLYVNRNLTGPVSDFVFGYLTHLGNGITATLIIILLLLFSSYRRAISLGAASISTFIIVQFFKLLIYSHVDRPIKYFHDMGIQDLHWPIGTKLYFSYSFPSGHTATAFTVFIFLVFTTKNHALKIVYFSCALLVGYSRIHLSQHFLTDVLAGSLLGIILAYLAARWYFQKGNPRLEGSLLYQKRSSQ